MFHHLLEVFLFNEDVKIHSGLGARGRIHCQLSITEVGYQCGPSNADVLMFVLLRVRLGLELFKHYLGKNTD